jgi:hypothetical protein
MPEVLLATPEMATEYARWFVNRLAYTRQSDGPHSEFGRHYYYRPRAEGGGELGLELDDVRRHLAGEITLGIYAINPKTQRVNSSTDPITISARHNPAHRNVWSARGALSGDIGSCHWDEPHRVRSWGNRQWPKTGSLTSSRVA